MVRKSIILSGQTTSLSLEKVLWEELEQQATEQNMKWQDYTRAILINCPSSTNRASFIRGALIKHLRGNFPVKKSDNSLFSSWLVELAGMFKRYDFQKGRIFIGIGEDNDIQINDEAISKHHLLLAFDRVRWWAIDLESKNGTWNHESVQIQCTIIDTGRAIHMGNSKIIYIP